MALRTFSWIFSGLLSPAGERGVHTPAPAPATSWISSVWSCLTPASAELGGRGMGRSLAGGDVPLQGSQTTRDPGESRPRSCSSLATARWLWFRATPACLTDIGVPVGQHDDDGGAPLWDTVFFPGLVQHADAPQQPIVDVGHWHTDRQNRGRVFSVLGWRRRG